VTDTRACVFNIHHATMPVYSRLLYWSYGWCMVCPARLLIWI